VPKAFPEIRLTPEFRRRVKKLSKRYRKLQSDLASVLEQLKAGEAPGDQIQGINITVMKVRVKNTDIRKGKSGGYRLIYWVASDELVVLLDFYSKSDRVNTDVAEITRIVSQFESLSDE